MDKELFLIHTTMEKEDYRKFLYTAAFFKKKWLLPVLLLISWGGAVLIQCSLSGPDWGKTALTTLLLFCFVILILCFKIEKRNRTRLKTDRTGSFGSENILHFYSDRLVFESPERKSTGELRYDQFYSLLESKDYYIFYLNANQAALLRKKDVPAEAADSLRHFLQAAFGKRYKRI